MEKVLLNGPKMYAGCMVFAGSVEEVGLHSMLEKNDKESTDVSTVKTEPEIGGGQKKR